MDVFTLEFWTALASIVFLDLVLAGDNAIVIAMAARSLPKDQQKKAILWGTAGAITIRILATVLLVKLLDLPWLHLAGGFLLVWIAFKLLVEEQEVEHVTKSGTTLMQSIKTIIIADAAMGLDNVLAIAGAAKSSAHGQTSLVVLGLLISIPLVVWGSTLFIKLLDRFGWIVYLGSAVLAYTAANMFISEQKIAHWFENDLVHWGFVIILIIGITGIGWLMNQRKQKQTVVIAAANRTSKDNSR